jgi:hypothetical protein
MKCNVRDERRLAALGDQLDGHAGANRVVDFGHGVSPAQQLRNHRG